MIQQLRKNFFIGSQEVYLLFRVVIILISMKSSWWGTVTGRDTNNVKHFLFSRIRDVEKFWDPQKLGPRDFESSRFRPSWLRKKHIWNMRLCGWPYDDWKTQHDEIWPKWYEPLDQLVSLSLCLCVWTKCEGKIWPMAIDLNQISDHVRQRELCFWTR